MLPDTLFIFLNTELQPHLFTRLHSLHPFHHSWESILCTSTACKEAKIADSCSNLETQIHCFLDHWVIRLLKGDPPAPELLVELVSSPGHRKKVFSLHHMQDNIHSKHCKQTINPYCFQQHILEDKFRKECWEKLSLQLTNGMILFLKLQLEIPALCLLLIPGKGQGRDKELDF